jgi:Tol biopolymer transport system component
VDWASTPYGHVWIRDLLTGENRRLTHSTERADGAAESPVVRRDLSTGQETELSRARTEAAFGGLSLSSDGRRLAFRAAVGPDQRHLMTLSVDGGEPTVLYRGRPGTLLPAPMAWTTDGKHILVAANDGGQRARVWALPADGAPPRKLELVAERIGKMSLSPDGTQLLFSGTTRKRELWVIDNLLSGLSSNR